MGIVMKLAYMGSRRNRQRTERLKHRDSTLWNILIRLERPVRFCSGIVVLALISCGTDCNSDEDWKQLLFKEAEVGNIPSVKELLSSKRCPDTVDDEGRTPLMIAATNGHYEVAKLLLEYGVKIDAKQKDGNTALMFAAAACEPRLVKLILNSGPYVPMRNYAGETSFDLAKQRADFWSDSTSNGLNVEQSFRVDLGGCPPRPPTDPYVRDYRIRFLKSRFRYALRPRDRSSGWVADNASGEG